MIDLPSEIPWPELLGVGVTLLLCAAALLLAAARRIPVGKEASWALVRGLLQVMAMGLLLASILAAPTPWAVLVLALMVAAAGALTRKRAGGLAGAYGIATASIGVGAGIVLAVAATAGAVTWSMRSLVPVGSLVIAFTMRSVGLTLDRAVDELRRGRDHVETLLCLGASPAVAVEGLLRRSVLGALVPALDSLRSLGWVWIPGVMTGLILAGEDPLRASLVQFVVIALVFAASVVATLVASWLVPRAAFDDRDRLRRLPQAAD